MFSVTLTLHTAIQYFHWKFWLMLLYHQTKFICKRIISSEDIVKTVISPTVTLKILKIANSIFSGDAPGYDDVSPHQIWLEKVLWVRR